ncbi:hypothetical protein [Actinoplanes sp. NPDC049802]|uniref:hypothetical protein n=1 Tax=Actinoplanes sp. NPDC049802 TaxID=3154742 RepID=UPI0033F294FE
MSSVGRARRLERLQSSDGTYRVLALDHGVTMGWTFEQEDPFDIALACAPLGVQGVVAHFGLLPRLSQVRGVELVMQTHASTPGDKAKDVVAPASVALELDCAAIAVEYNATGSSRQMANAAAVVHAAHAVGLVVLVMANYDRSSFRSLGQAIVAASQLGADLVKVALPDRPDRDALAWGRRIVESSPPCLLAGGDVDVDLSESVALATDLGFRGYCIGRKFFTPDGRRDAFHALRMMGGTSIS